MSGHSTDWHIDQGGNSSRLLELAVGSLITLSLFTLVAWTISTETPPSTESTQSQRIRYAPQPPPPPPSPNQQEKSPDSSSPSLRRPLKIEAETFHFELQALSTDFSPTQSIDTLSKIDIDFSELKTSRSELDEMVVYHRTELDSRLQPQFRPMPRIKKRTKGEDSVRIMFIVDKTGKVEDGVYILYSTDPELNEDIIKGVKRWTFSPPTRNGKKVRAKATIRIDISSNNPSPWGN